MHGNGNTNPDLHTTPEPPGPDWDTRHLEALFERADEIQPGPRGADVNAVRRLAGRDMTTEPGRDCTPGHEHGRIMLPDVSHLWRQADTDLLDTPQDPGWRRERRDLDQSDYEADGQRMADEQEWRESLAILVSGHGLPCTWPGCNGFFFAEIMREPGPQNDPPGQDGWVYLPVPDAYEDNPALMPAHDCATAYEAGNYLPGREGRPYRDEPTHCTDI